MPKFQANGIHSIVPEGWVDRSTLTLVGPTSEDGFAANIVVTRQPIDEGTDVTAFGKSQCEELAASFEAMRVDDERTIRLKGREVYQRLHALQLGGRWVQQVQTYFVRGPHPRTGLTEGFVVTGSAAVESFDANQEFFKRFTEAFEFSDD
ncbi:MAG: DcrB-related protein [Myxococcota bacterium]